MSMQWGGNMMKKGSIYLFEKTADGAWGQPHVITPFLDTQKASRWVVENGTLGSKYLVVQVRSNELEVGQRRFLVEAGSGKAEKPETPKA